MGYDKAIHMCRNNYLLCSVGQELSGTLVIRLDNNLSWILSKQSRLMLKHALCEIGLCVKSAAADSVPTSHQKPSLSSSQHEDTNSNLYHAYDLA